MSDPQRDAVLCFYGALYADPSNLVGLNNLYLVASTVGANQAILHSMRAELRRKIVIPDWWGKEFITEYRPKGPASFAMSGRKICVKIS